MMPRRQNVLRIIALSLPALVAASLPAAEPATHQWLRGTGDNLEIRLHGEVVEADGTPAAAFSVTGGINAYGNHKSPLLPKIDGNRFEAWIPVTRIRPYSFWLKAETDDGSRLATHRLNGHKLRQAAIDGLRLTLAAPGRQVAVKVVAGGRPMASATVQAEAGFGILLRATTDADGIARLALPAGETLTDLMAWTDNQVGGFDFSRKPKRDPAANEHVIELSPCRDQKMRFVDEQGAPIEGLSFVVHIATPPPNHNFIGVNEHSRFTTNAAGEAVHHWYPDWPKAHFYPDLEGGKWIADDEPDLVDGIYVYQLKPARQRRRVDMALSGAEVRGLQVSVQSFQGERESHSDHLAAWTDDQGRYAVDVLPDATYCAYVQDETWVTPLVDFVPFDSALGTSASPDLPVTKGQEIEILVSTGAEKKPYPHLAVALFREHSYTWREEGETRSGTGSSQWWAETNASGRAITRTLPGPLKVSVYSPLWRTEQEINVIPGQSTTVRLHCNVDQKTRVSGRLVAVEGQTLDPAAIDLKWGAVDGKFDEEASLSCDAGGNFALETAATQVGVFAATRDGRAAGAAVAKDLATPLEVRLVPTSDYQGQLVDYNDKPLADRPVRAIVRVRGDKAFDSVFLTGFEAARIETITDAEGKFTFERVPSKLEVALFTDPIEGDDSSYIDNIQLEPDEHRVRTVHRVGPRPTAAPTPLAERLATARRDGQLLGFRLMVVCSFGSASATEFVDRRFVDHEENHDVSSYMQVVIHGAEGKLADEAVRFLAERGWQAPAQDSVAAWALDEQGRELSHIELAITDPEAPQAAADFVHRFMPPQIDAVKKWDEAFAEAKRTNRRVWARVSQRYCGPCFTMARWLDDQQDLVAKDYVLLKIDNVRDLNGQEVAERLTRGASHGVPFHAIFDTEQRLLVDSAGPLGNVGHPAGFDGNKQLRKMLTETRQNLTDADVDHLIQTVGP